MSRKPQHIVLRDTDLKSCAATDGTLPPRYLEQLDEYEFKTPGQRDGATAILRHWEDTHNLNEIARRSDWSNTHIQDVYTTYFEECERDEELHNTTTDRQRQEYPDWVKQLVEEDDDIVDVIIKAYEKGKREG